jgi:hypothetical protein
VIDRVLAHVSCRVTCFLAQALGVQVQDSENEMDALDETGLFVQKIAALVDKWIVQQSADVTETRQRVQVLGCCYFVLACNHSLAHSSHQFSRFAFAGRRAALHLVALTASGSAACALARQPPVLH